MRCHPVFHVSLLEPYYENEFNDRSNQKGKNIRLTTDYIEKIPEKINDMKVKGKNYYLVSWKGRGTHEDSGLKKVKFLTNN